VHYIPQPRRFRRRGWIGLAAIILALILVITTGAIVTTLRAQGQQYQSAVGTPVFHPSATPTTVTLPPGSQVPLPPPYPISGPPSTATPPRLAANAGIVYSDDEGIYLLTADAAEPEKLNTPNYISRVLPRVTNNGYLLYATNNGLYLLDLLHRDSVKPLQVASINGQTQIIASTAISSDGQAVFWSVEPHTGKGVLTLYTATLTSTGVSAPTALYSQSAGACPCYMLFGTGPAGTDGSPSLLLTDDLGTPGGQGTGLWSFDLATQQIGSALLDDNQGQAPLALSTDYSQLAFAPTTGQVPEPTDNSVPNQVANQPYGNSIAVSAWGSGALNSAVTLVPQQGNVPTFSSYHWITTPVFSPDGHTLAYIQFSADDSGPYDRHNTLYIADTTGINTPVVVANFNTLLVELGGWLDSHTLILYSDNGIYALNVNTSAISLLAATFNYSHIIGLVNLTETAAGSAATTPGHSRQSSQAVVLPTSGSQSNQNEVSTNVFPQMNRSFPQSAAPAQPLPQQPLNSILAASSARADTRGFLRVRQ
jgi:hypothetical protein